MKNFARLARFAWPYRVRFILSLGCAVMVAFLWFTNLSAVYPLLQILFHSQNCQKWVAEKVVDTKIDIASRQARVEALETVASLTDNGRRKPGELGPTMTSILADASTLAHREESELQVLQRKFDDFGVIQNGPNVVAPGAADKKALSDQRLKFKQADARYDEFKVVLPMARKGDGAGMTHRAAILKSDLAKDMKWLAFYEWLQPRINHYLPADGFKTLLLLIGVVMLGVAVKGLFMFMQEVLVADIMQLSLFDIRNLFYRRTMNLDLASFSDQGSAELMSRFTSDMDSVSQGLNTILSKVVREPLRVMSCLGGALWFNWRLTLLALVLVPVSAATTYRAGKIMKRAVRRSLESMSNIYKILQESFQGVKVVKAFTMERYERRRFFLETKALYKKSLRVAMIDALSDPVLELLALSTVSIAILAGSYLVLRHTVFLDLGLIRIQLASQPMTIEDLFTLYAMLAGVSDPIRKLANVHSKIQRAAAASDRICALMDRTPEVADKTTAVRLKRHHQTIEFDQVWFGYNDRDSVLKGLDLTVRHGETIALVGPNGCGKSTLMNLLPRFYDVASGAIRIDGHDLRDVRIRGLRTQIGMVTQETVLFEDSIANNIAYGTRHAGRDLIVAAAKRAYAHQFIMAMPEGYDTVIHERGLSLSGGQRQRLALARAMLRDPSILILDEATSAVDIQDEALIRKAIEEFSRSRTTFIITHSLAGLCFADRIVLMNSGRIEAVGTDAELRRTSPLYRRLHEIHFQRESA
jgi:ABC-type multidrug transport system fused ATPase/permease subunit